MNPVIKNVYSTLKNKKLDGLFVSFTPNISYLTAIRSRDSFLLLSSKKNIYFTDSRYIAEAKKYLKHCEIRKIEGAIFRAIFESCSALKLKRVGFEEKHLSFIGHEKLSKEFKGSIDLVPTKGIIEDLRMIKSADEIKKIKKATEITILAFNYLRDLIVPGKTELEIAGELERFIRLKGANSSAFDIIVASGPNSSFPHHLSSQRKIKNHEPVLIDLGVDYLGYKSDLTRVFFLGKISTLIKEVYAIVKEAQAKAIKRIKAGVAAKTIDSQARNFIAEKGFAQAFSHSLGHGVGLDIHEAPGISPKSEDILKQGMVFTVEPGIYLPGKFGIRIEDMVVVTRKGTDLISGSLNQ